MAEDTRRRPLIAGIGLATAVRSAVKVAQEAGTLTAKQVAKP